MVFPHPGNDLSIIEADDQLHLHRNFASQSFNDANDVRVLAARRHEIDQAHGATLCFDFRFQDKRVSTVPATRFYDVFLREKPPVSVSRIAQKRGKARRRVKPRKTKPINTAVATHERAGLRIAQKRVILDLCICLRHFDSSSYPHSRSCSCSCSTFSDSASLAIPSRVNRNTVHSSSGLAPSAR